MLHIVKILLHINVFMSARGETHVVADKVKDFPIDIFSPSL